MNNKEFRDSLPKLDITDPDIFFNRRKFIKSMTGAGLASLSMINLEAQLKVRSPLDLPLKRDDVFPTKRNPDFNPSDLELTDRMTAATHNNFYEFLPGRGGPAWELTEKFKPEPWKIEIVGECNKPMTIDLDDIFKFAHEERVYRFRCVETWAMNIPWSGFPLAELLKKVEPTAKAKHVRFTTANIPAQMPGLAEDYPWPYHEALRIDEAMNPLAMLVTGVYGQPLPTQHGSPIRVIVPWKYGYKNPKSIVKIELLEKQPLTFWGRPPYMHEYGYLSNVNPNIPHPRWSQEIDRLLEKGKGSRGGAKRPTLIFNGYEKYVGELYPDEPRTPQEPLVQGQIAR
jgi:methionine sulfoxide reductase catalytic subunit